ncbi:MAG TPA: sugar transferase [Candidatus Limnocylindrales bacterium]|nr:sugar transferase [Candidatus Limnocylindrales bacterium]
MTKGQAAAKRAFDFTVALLALALLWPVFAIIAALIKLDTKGPVFFRQERAAAGGGTFRIYKFRTMIVGAYRSGARLTVKRDPRITTVGHFLRWTKLDELPQLLNVLAGDMSFVGPRPEDPYFTNFYTPEQRVVLSVKPGIIGPSQIDGRDEVEKYPEGCENVEEFYIQSILPEKLERDIEYARTATFVGDVRFLVGGFLRVLLTQFKSGFFARQRYRFAALALDIALMVVAYVGANLIKFDWYLDAEGWAYVGKALIWVVILKPPVFVYYGLYQRTPRWMGRRDLAAIVKAVSTSSALLVAMTYFSLQRHSRAVFLIDWVLLLSLVAGSRYIVRSVLSGVARSEERGPFVKVLVAGSGHGVEAILRSLLEDPNSRFMPVGIIDHEPHRWGALIHGVRVMGGATDIAMAASTHGVEMVLISLADLDPMVVREIAEACEKLGLQYRLVPALSDLLAQGGPEPLNKVVLSSQARV